MSGRSVGGNNFTEKGATQNKKVDRTVAKKIVTPRTSERKTHAVDHDTTSRTLDLQTKTRGNEAPKEALDQSQGCR